MQIGLEPAGLVLRLEAQRVVRPAGRPSRRHWCGTQSVRAAPSPSTFISTARNGASSTVMPTFSTGVTRKYLSLLALEHRGEQLDQRGPADRRLQIEPGAVGGDAHVEIAAERRVPQMHRRRALLARALCRTRDARPARLSSRQPCALTFAHDLAIVQGLRYQNPAARSRERDVHIRNRAAPKNSVDSKRIGESARRGAHRAWRDACIIRRQEARQGPAECVTSDGRADKTITGAVRWRSKVSRNSRT